MEVAPDRHLTVTHDHSLDEPPMKRRSCRRRACRRLRSCEGRRALHKESRAEWTQARPGARHAQPAAGPQRVDRIAGTGARGALPGGAAPPVRGTVSVAPTLVSAGGHWCGPGAGPSAGPGAEWCGTAFDGNGADVTVSRTAPDPGALSAIRRRSASVSNPGANPAPNVTVRSVNDVGIRNIPVITCDGATPAAAFTRPKSSPHIRAGHAFGEFDAIECREIC
jgi:hypothetical protein